MTARSLSLALVVTSLLAARSVHADDAPAPDKKSLYALPFAMRPAIAPNLARIDASWTTAEATAGTTKVKASIVSSIVTAGGKPIAAIPDLGFYARMGFVRSNPDPGDTGSAFTNPLAFALYTPEVAPKLRLPLFAGVTAPIGSGGGNDPSLTARTAAASGIYARQAMDNALFATNYLTPTLGAGLAWIDRGFTAQLETTVLFLRRVRGEKLDGDSARTNFTAGVNLGYRVVPLLSVNVELHYQRWLTTPLAVQKDEAKSAADQLGVRDQLTFGLGVRANLPLGGGTMARPGLGYFRGIDKPMSEQKFSIVQLDLPIAF